MHKPTAADVETAVTTAGNMGRIAGLVQTDAGKLAAFRAVETFINLSDLHVAVQRRMFNEARERYTMAVTLGY